MARQWDQPYVGRQILTTEPGFAVGRLDFMDPAACPVCLTYPNLAAPAYGVPVDVAEAARLSTVAGYGVRGGMTAADLRKRVSPARQAVADLLGSKGGIGKVARRAGVDVSWLSRVLTGRISRPNPWLLRDAARELGVSVDRLLDLLDELWATAPETGRGRSKPRLVGE